MIICTKLRKQLLVLFSLLMLISLSQLACSKQEDAPSRGTKAESGDDDDDDDDDDEVDDEPDEGDIKFNASTQALKTEEVMKYFKETCGACHGTKEDGSHAANYSSWPMADDQLTKKAFEVSIFAPIVYATLTNKVAEKPSNTPAPMPPRDLKDDEEKTAIRGILAWFNINLPFVVAEAEQSYGLVHEENRSESILTFRCTNPVTGRKFMNRFFNAVFDRPPKPTDLALLTEEELNSEITYKIREKLVSKLKEPAWRNDFVERGLRKLAAAIGGAPSVTARNGISQATADDIKLELWLLMRKYYNNFEYKEYFTTNKVFVSERTAPFYKGCQGQANDYVECTMDGTRDGFFTTLGYLNSKPSSFLIENNNYGRTAMMYFTLMGQGFQAAFDEESGETVAPLPECLEPTDTRLRSGAPRGAAAIPAFGNVCQSCHISRNMATGSVAFRKYSQNGSVYTTENLTSVDAEAYAEAIAEDWTFTAKPGDDPTTGTQVTPAFLESLLTTAPKACVIPGNKSRGPIAVKTPGDLADYLLENERALVRGFIRHAHRVFTRSLDLNFDLVYTAIQSYEEGNKKLPDLLNSYFMSETFSCDSEKGEIN